VDLRLQLQHIQTAINPVRAAGQYNHSVGFRHIRGLRQQ
jgi:hypothetical protein